MTGRFNAPANARFDYVLMGMPKQYYLLSSNFGYGFIVQYQDMFSKTKGGKATLTVPKGSGVLLPSLIEDIETAQVVAATSCGYLLIINASDLPQMTKGKGNKIINIPVKTLKAGDEVVVAVAVLYAGQKLIVHSGKKFKTIQKEELLTYVGERGRRGKMLPRGYQNITALEVS